MFLPKIYLIKIVVEYKNFNILMIKILTQSKTYQEILDNQTTKTITIPYHIDTGIVVSMDNIEELSQIEWNDYEIRLKEIQLIIPTFNVIDLKQKLRKRMEDRMGVALLQVKYIYITSSTIKEASESIENLPDFVEWCVE